MNKESNYMEMMLDSLDKKISVLTKISTVNKSQKELAKQDNFDVDEFDKTVEEKGIYIDELQKLDDGFQTLFDRIKEPLTNNPKDYSEYVTKMQDRIRTITELSATVEAEEKRIHGMMQIQFGKLKVAIKESKKNSKLVSNYYKSMSKLDYEPQFMDKKK